jgi:HAD superfamily hydrolase (TIGR01549 family)
MNRAIIFDVDGTLVDSVDQHALAWVDAFRRFGKEVPFREVRSHIGKGGDQLMPVFFPRQELDRIGAEMQKVRSEIYKEKYLQQVTAFPGVRPLFERIRADGFRIALASSAARPEFEANLKLLEVEDLVDAATAGSDARRSKPFPDLFEAALEKLETVPPDGALVIGDTPYDAEAASKAGLPILGLLCGGFPEDDLRAAGCQEIWRDPEDLLANYARTLMARLAGKNGSRL